MNDSFGAKRRATARCLTNADPVLVGAELSIVDAPPADERLRHEHDERDLVFEFRVRFYEKSYPIGPGLVRFRLNYAVVDFGFDGLRTSDKKVSNLFKQPMSSTKSVRRGTLDQGLSFKGALELDVSPDALAKIGTGQGPPVKASLDLPPGRQSVEAWIDDEEERLVERQVVSGGEGIRLKVSATPSNPMLSGYLDIYAGLARTGLDVPRIEVEAKIEAESCIELIADKNLERAMKAPLAFLHVSRKKVSHRVFENMGGKILQQTWIIVDA